MVDKNPFDEAQRRQLNHTVYRLFKEDIRRNYPLGRLVAISDGKIVADAADFAEMDRLLEAQGLYPPDTLVVEAGVDLPEYAIILTPFLNA